MREQLCLLIFKCSSQTANGSDDIVLCVVRSPYSYRQGADFTFSKSYTYCPTEDRTVGAC